MVFDLIKEQLRPSTELYMYCKRHLFTRGKGREKTDQTRLGVHVHMTCMLYCTFEISFTLLLIIRSTTTFVPRQSYDSTHPLNAHVGRSAARAVAMYIVTCLVS